MPDETPLEADRLYLEAVKIIKEEWNLSDAQWRQDDAMKSLFDRLWSEGKSFEEIMEAWKDRDPAEILAVYDAEACKRKLEREARMFAAAAPALSDPPRPRRAFGGA